MKASEIVTKIKDVLLSTNSEEEVTTPEVELRTIFSILRSPNLYERSLNPSR